MSASGAFEVLKIRDFRAFQSGRFFFTFGLQMQSVLVGWQVYSITKDPFSLGLIGLAEAIPFLSSALFAGNVADTYNRKKIIATTVSIYLLCAALLLFVSSGMQNLLADFGVMPIYAIIFITGFARGFLSPAVSSFMAQIVPRELYGQSSTWNSILWQTAAVCGPAVGGLVYGYYNILIAYLLVVIFTLIGLISFLSIKKKAEPVTVNTNESLKERLSAGIKFFFNNQIMLSAISLDMFAVLFGGAVALLPAFADKVLQVGPEGLGIMRAAPAVGSVLIGLAIAYYPPKKNAGKILLTCVAGFGLSIILFAVSKNFYLSVFALALSGAFDNVSVIIRHTILQLYTPDDMRGRVNAINFIFVGTSNELGSFESGLAARLLGLVPSVIFGGCMTVLITGTVYKTAPQLKELDL